LTVVQQQAGSAIRPFRMEISAEALDDLRRRLAATCWPGRELVDNRSQGVQLATIQEVACHSPNSTEGAQEHLPLPHVPREGTPQHRAEGQLLEQYGPERADDEGGAPWQGQVVADVLERRPGPGLQPADEVDTRDDAYPAERPAAAVARTLPVEARLRATQPVQPGPGQQRRPRRAADPPRRCSR